MNKREVAPDFPRSPLFVHKSYNFKTLETLINPHFKPDFSLFLFIIQPFK